MDSPQRYCVNCGSLLGAGAAFCHGCGTAASPSAPAAGNIAGGGAQPLPPGFDYQGPLAASPGLAPPRPLARSANPNLPWVIVGLACGIPLLLAVLGIVASIGIPLLLSSQMADEKEQAREALRMVVSAQFAYYAQNGEYADDVAELAREGFVDAAWSSGDLGNGLKLELTGEGNQFIAVACYENSSIRLTADESGQIRDV